MLEFQIDTRELSRQLLEFPDKLARRSLSRAASSGAAVVRNRAREYARAIGLHDTGRLVRSISIMRVRTPNWRRESIYGVYHSMTPYLQRVTHLSGERYVFNYGAAYERGFISPAGERKHRPHIRPALDENIGEVIEAVRNRLALEIRVMRWELGTGQKFVARRHAHLLDTDE